MSVVTKTLNCKLRTVYRRFIHAETKKKERPQWIKPDGHETDITIYNPMTKCNVPLITKHKNVLTWYMCGPTVYDSAHIGHAMTYVKSDIIRRILSDHFNINVITVMPITDIDDKIINRAKQTEQSYQDLTKHYENEFVEDMNMLNVAKPHLYCRVTDYIPQIIQFVNSIVNKGNAYVSKDGSVYFDTTKFSLYGKLSTAFPDNPHPDKKSVLDFSLWKGSKPGEPFWESPWGPGRPGWHIECSTIASTVFGNSIDIHSGGIDLAFPHHENEEAQSCAYHEVDQWVNYWLHCGHLILGDVKMSKSLNNTISIREFLQKYTTNQFRIHCLLTNYRTEIKFGDEIMCAAVIILHKIEHFISDCHNYIAGRWVGGNVDEVTLLRTLEETKVRVNEELANDFNTAQVMQSLDNLIHTANEMLHCSQTQFKNTSIPAIVAVSDYVLALLSKFGIKNSTEADDCKLNNLVEHFIKFRTTVRERGMNQGVKDKILLKACDEARSNLSSCGVVVKDIKNETIWSIKKY